MDARGDREAREKRHAEAVHRIDIGHAQEWRRDVRIDDILPYLLHHALKQGVNVFTGDERRLDVHLGELHLAIGAQILVAEAAGDLEIFLHTGDHEDLLELLGRLRERIKLSGVNARRHEIFAGTFRSGFEECRCLDLDELLGIEVVANRFRCAVAQLEVFAHFRPAQIEITISKAQVLVDLVAADVVERERRRIGEIMNRERGRIDLDGPRWQVRVDRAFGTSDDRATNTDDRLRFDVCRLSTQLRVSMWIELHLRDTFAVA